MLMAAADVVADVVEDVVANMVVRAAGPADAAVLSRLCAAHAAHEHIRHEGEGHAERLAQALQTHRLRIWLGLMGGEPVGYASTTLDFSTLDAQSFVHLDCLYLEPGARGLGLGRALMATVAQYARDIGARQLQWQTPMWNGQAVRFYDALGACRLDKCRYTLAV